MGNDLNKNEKEEELYIHNAYGVESVVEYDKLNNVLNEYDSLYFVINKELKYVIECMYNKKMYNENYLSIFKNFEIGFQNIINACEHSLNFNLWIKRKNYLEITNYLKCDENDLFYISENSILFLKEFFNIKSKRENNFEEVKIIFKDNSVLSIFKRDS